MNVEALPGFRPACSECGCPMSGHFGDGADAGCLNGDCQDLMAAELPRLLWSRAELTGMRDRCPDCAFHTPTMGHHDDCPTRKDQT